MTQNTTSKIKEYEHAEVGEVAANEAGGKQTKIESMITEVPPLALKEVGKIMGLGATNYPREEDDTPNWHKIDCFSNLDHALEHVANFLILRNAPRDDASELDEQREELGHATARMMMAMEQFIRETE